MRIKTIGYLISTIASIPIIAVALSPNNVDNLYVDFILFVASRLYPEAIVIFLLGIVILSYPKIIRVILLGWRVFLQLDPRKNSYLSTIILSVSIATMIFLTVPVVDEGYYAARARVYYLQNLIYRDFRKELVQKLNSHVERGEYDAALKLYKRISYYYTNDYVVNRLSYRLESVERMVNYAREYNSRGRKIINNQGVDRRGMIFLASASSIYPMNEEMFDDFRYHYKILQNNCKRPAKAT